MNYKTLFIPISILALILSACSANNESDSSKVTASEQIGMHEGKSDVTTLPAFNMFNAAGKIVSLESFKGKKIFVNLWASWCPPCRREMPSIEKLYQSVDTNKVAFVLLSLDDQFEKGRKYISSKKFALPFYYPSEDLPSIFRVEGIPATFIFNENGALIKRVDGSDDYNTKYYKTLLK